MLTSPSGPCTEWCSELPAVLRGREDEARAYLGRAPPRREAPECWLVIWLEEERKVPPTAKDIVQLFPRWLPIYVFLSSLMPEGTFKSIL